MIKKRDGNNRITEVIWKTLVILCIGVVGGYLVLVLAFALPLGRMYNNVLQSSSAFSPDYTLLIHNNLATKTDDYTDALMLMTAANGADRNPFTAAAYDYYWGRDGKSPNETITNIENSENKSIAYSRYWHGYLLFLKPLLMFFDYNEIMVITSILVVVLMVIVVYLLKKKSLEKLIVPYSVVVALMFPIAISLSLQYMNIFVILNLVLIGMLLFYERIEKSNWFFYMFLVIGMATCYFDLLTTPIVTFGIPLAVWLIMKNREKILSFWGNMKLIITGAIAWGIGYGGIWVGKWTLGSIVTGKNLFADAMGAAEQRMSTTTVGEISRFQPVAEAFKYTFSKPVIVLLIIAIIVVVVLLIAKRIRFNKKKAVDNLWMFVIAMIPLIWYMLLVNHSSWHIFFTYRTLGVFTFAVICYAVSVFDLAKQNKIKEKHRKEKKIGRV